MREMKDSGIPWIGEIPKEWEIFPVKYYFTIGRGRVISVFDLVENGKYPVYSSQTENDGCFGFLNTYDYCGPAITWTTDGAKAGTVFLRDGKYNCTNVCGILQLRKQYKAKSNLSFLTYAIGMVANQNKRYDINGFKIMSNEMANIRFGVPPISEQNRIADYLDTKCARINSIRKNVEAEIEALKQYKKSVITEAVTKGLDKNVEMKDSGIPWIGKIPKDWKKDKFKYHLKRSEPRNPGNQVVLSLYRDYGIIPKDSRDDNHNVTSEDTSNYKYVQIGDFVVNKMKAWQGSVAVSNYEGIVSPAYYVYKFSDHQIYKKYLHYLLRACYKDEFMRLSGGLRVGQWDLSADGLGNTYILIPPYNEQVKIANYLDNKVVKIDSIIQKKQELLANLDTYKKSLIYEYVTGKKEVPAV